jgi:hypothetical protein
MPPPERQTPHGGGFMGETDMGNLRGIVGDRARHPSIRLPRDSWKCGWGELHLVSLHRGARSDEVPVGGADEGHPG